MKIGKNQKFKNRLNLAMAKKNLRQVDLVESTGIPSSAITMYCNGKYLPKQKNLKLIAKTLDVTESWLIEDEIDQTEEKLLKIYRKLPDQKKKMLLKYCLKILTQ